MLNLSPEVEGKVARFWRALPSVTASSMLPESAEKGVAVTRHPNASVSSCKNLMLTKLG